jgi:hypothetical protein
MLSPTAKVKRDGAPQVVAAEELVPGDIVLLKSGDKVPADLRLVSATNLQVWGGGHRGGAAARGPGHAEGAQGRAGPAHARFGSVSRAAITGDLALTSLPARPQSPIHPHPPQTPNPKPQVQEAMLTGESVPVSKEAGKTFEPHAPLGDRRNMAYSATSVVSGQAEGVVIGTGDSAEIGQISRMVNTVRRPLGRGRRGGVKWAGRLRAGAARSTARARPSVRCACVVPCGVWLDCGQRGACTHPPPRTNPPFPPPPPKTNHQVEVVTNNLEKQMSVFGRWLAVIVLLIVVAAFLLAKFRARETWQDSFEVGRGAEGGGWGVWRAREKRERERACCPLNTSAASTPPPQHFLPPSPHRQSAVSIAVAVIPEGLPAMVRRPARRPGPRRRPMGRDGGRARTANAPTRQRGAARAPRRCRHPSYLPKFATASAPACHASPPYETNPNSTR